MFSYFSNTSAQSTNQDNIDNIPEVEELNSSTKKVEESVLNPGSFDSLTEKSSEIVDLEQHAIHGVQVNIQNYVNERFLTGHTFHWGKKENVNPFTGEKDEERSLYAYNAMLSMGNWLFNGRIGTGGTLRSYIGYNGGDPSGKSGVNGHISGQFSPDGRSMLEGELSYSKYDFTLQGKFQGPTLGVSYTQAISKLFSGGVELFWSPLNDSVRLKYVGRRQDKEAGNTATLAYTTGIGPDQLVATYTQELTQRLDVTTELDLGYEHIIINQQRKNERVNQ
eukprot:TRINITY_DN779_c0_g1_i2.p1 TRINITY_DN779_c0_g1~~TRINITY_DN779_c0_g1_i2.p1  ORF type:complete len:279 (-),score=58.83 TRINITY_DN779_c0_g1_i2:125-961(-)